MAEPKETRPFLKGTYYKDQTKLTMWEWLRKTLLPQSEFDKPYLTSGYPEQEGYKPDDDPKPYEFDLDGPTDDSYTATDDVPETQEPDSSECIFEFQDIDDCTIKSQYSFAQYGAEIDWIKVTKITGGTWSTVNWEEGIDYGLESSGTQEREKRNYKDTIWFKPRESEIATGDGVIHMQILVRHLNGKLYVARLLCLSLIGISCCDTSTALAFDDASTADTIGTGASITLYITGSGSPFTWSVLNDGCGTNGTGFSLASAETEDTTNTLSTTPSADGYADITVTDCSGASINFQIRCTAGTWTLVGDCVRDLACSGSCTGCDCNSQCGGVDSLIIEVSAVIQWGVIPGCVCSHCTPGCGFTSCDPGVPTPPCAHCDGCWKADIDCSGLGATCYSWVGGIRYKTFGC